MAKLDKEYLTLQASYLRCCCSSGFFDTFYDTFLNKSPEVVEKFSKTDFSNQKKMLKDSLFLMVADSRKENSAGDEIKRIGRTHSRNQRNIEPHLYTLWLDSLCESIKKHDMGYTNELENLWRNKMEKVIKQITQMY